MQRLRYRTQRKFSSCFWYEKLKCKSKISQPGKHFTLLFLNEWQTCSKHYLLVKSSNTGRDINVYSRWTEPGQGQATNGFCDIPKQEHGILSTLFWSRSRTPSRLYSVRINHKTDTKSTAETYSKWLVSYNHTSVNLVAVYTAQNVWDTLLDSETWSRNFEGSTCWYFLPQSLDKRPCKFILSSEFNLSMLFRIIHVLDHGCSDNQNLSSWCVLYRL